jgi:hypothetical protein
MKTRTYKEVIANFSLGTSREDVFKAVNSLDTSINYLCNSILLLLLSGEVTIEEEQNYLTMICGHFEGIRVYLFKDHIIVNDFRYQIPIAYNRIYTKLFSELCELQQEQNNNKNKDNE